MTTSLHYPVVGCAVCAHRQAGQYDRRWAVVDADGRWLSGQTCVALQGVTTDIKMGYLVLRAPGMLRMDIPLDVIEDDDSVLRSMTLGSQQIAVVDEGDVAAVWFGHVTGQICRLVKIHPEAPEIDWPEF